MLRRSFGTRSNLHAGSISSKLAVRRLANISARVYEARQSPFASQRLRVRSDLERHVQRWIATARLGSALPIRLD
jgi:hypothetical protein